MHVVGLSFKTIRVFTSLVCTDLSHIVKITGQHRRSKETFFLLKGVFLLRTPSPWVRDFAPVSRIPIGQVLTLGFVWHCSRASAREGTFLCYALCLSLGPMSGLSAQLFLNDPSLHSSLTGVLIECCLVRLRTESRVLGPQRLAGLRYFASALSPYCGGDRLFVFVMLMFVFHEGNFRLWLVSNKTVTNLKQNSILFLTIFN